MLMTGGYPKALLCGTSGWPYLLQEKSGNESDSSGGFNDGVGFNDGS